MGNLNTHDLTSSLLLGAVVAPLGAAALWAAACLHRSLDASAAAGAAPGGRLGAMEAAASAPDAALTAAYLRLVEALTWVSLLEAPVKRGARSCGKRFRGVACMRYAGFSAAQHSTDSELWTRAYCSIVQWSA